MATMSSVFGGDPQGTSPIEDPEDPRFGAQGSTPLTDGSSDFAGSDAADEAAGTAAVAGDDGADTFGISSTDAGDGGTVDDGTAPPLIGTALDGSGETMAIE